MVYGLDMIKLGLCNKLGLWCATDRLLRRLGGGTTQTKPHRLADGFFNRSYSRISMQTAISSTSSTHPNESFQPTPRWEDFLRKAVIVIARLALAWLFFTQLWWKLPPTFGCPADFAIKQEDGKGGYTKSSGLCTWLGYEAIFADKAPRKFLVAEPKYLPGSPIQEIALDLTWLTTLNGQIVENVIAPNVRTFGYVIWFSEFAVFVLLFLGLFTRIGGLIALGVSAQLTLGLAGIAIPGDYEWEWAYNQMVVLSLLMIGLAPGRVLGLDALIRKWAAPRAANGNVLAKLLMLVS
jgi:uncharacterized membrane protein YphA (DoxX/SURF4 family)